jgi:hypothetical protein
VPFGTGGADLPKPAAPDVPAAKPVVPQAPEAPAAPRPVVPQAPEAALAPKPVVPQAPEAVVAPKPVVPQAPEAPAVPKPVVPEAPVGNRPAVPEAPDLAAAAARARNASRVLNGVAIANAGLMAFNLIFPDDTNPKAVQRKLTEAMGSADGQAKLAEKQPAIDAAKGDIYYRLEVRVAYTGSHSAKAQAFGSHLDVKSVEIRKVDVSTTDQTAMGKIDYPDLPEEGKANRRTRMGGGYVWDAEQFGVICVKVPSGQQVAEENARKEREAAQRQEEQRRKEAAAARDRKALEVSERARKKQAMEADEAERAHPPAAARLKPQSLDVTPDPAAELPIAAPLKALGAAPDVAQASHRADLFEARRDWLLQRAADLRSRNATSDQDYKTLYAEYDKWRKIWKASLQGEIAQIEAQDNTVRYQDAYGRLKPLAAWLAEKGEVLDQVAAP